MYTYRLERFFVSFLVNFTASLCSFRYYVAVCQNNLFLEILHLPYCIYVYLYYFFLIALIVNWHFMQTSQFHALCNIYIC